MTPAQFSHRVRLRPTLLSDLEFVIQVETDSHNLLFITPWERPQHEGAVRFPDFRHFIVEAGAGYAPTGFVILQGCRNPHRSVELKRLVLRHEGQGQGHGACWVGRGRVPYNACQRVVSQGFFGWQP